MNPWLPGAIVAAAVVFTVLGLWLPGVAPYPPSASMPSLVLSYAFNLAMIGAGLVAWSRRPGSKVGRLMVAIGFASYAWLIGLIPTTWTSLTWTVSDVLGLAPAPILAHLYVSFPSGRLGDRRDRLIVATAYGLWAAVAIGRHLIWDPHLTCAGCPTNLLLVWPNDELAAAVRSVGNGASLLVVIGVAFAVARHWRGARAVGRRALLPVILASPLVMAAWGTFFVGQAMADSRLIALSTSELGQVTGLVLPLSFVAGIFRLRLARASVADLAVQLAHGLPPGGLRDALARSLGDPTLELLFPAADGEGLVDASGRPASVPAAANGRSIGRLEHDGTLTAVLVHDPALTAEDPGLVEAVGAVARLALENERLAAQVRAQLDEVRASRARVIAAADDERRRIERDLHDGAQQALVTLALRLQQARERATSPDPDLGTLLEQATTELNDALRELRQLARGIHPTALVEAGLGAAIEALAERAALPVRVSCLEGRFPPAIESAAYFVVAEALTNVARHAGASEASVTVTRMPDDGLNVVVRDDGSGGASAERGSGLRGLADRVAAVGGRLTVESPAGGGTLVRAELPVR